LQEPFWDHLYADSDNCVMETPLAPLFSLLTQLSMFPILRFPQGGVLAVGSRLPIRIENAAGTQYLALDYSTANGGLYARRNGANESAQTTTARSVVASPAQYQNKRFWGLDSRPAGGSGNYLAIAGYAAPAGVIDPGANAFAAGDCRVVIGGPNCTGLEIGQIVVRRAFTGNDVPDLNTNALAYHQPT
jgi:hypothetical protein